MRPFIQATIEPFRTLPSGGKRSRDFPCAGFSADFCELIPDPAGGTLQGYSAPIQQTALRERINGGVIAMNFIKKGVY